MGPRTHGRRNIPRGSPAAQRCNWHLPRQPARHHIQDGMQLPDEQRRSLGAAQGWLELGALAESAAELENIAPEHRKHPDVLRIRWGIAQAAHDWTGAAQVARELIAIAADEFDGYWMLSFALHEMKCTQEACDNLTRVQEQFRREYLLHYNLACYLTQLGRLDEARNSLRQAFQLNPSMRATAANDPDLEPLRGDIGQIR